MDNEMFKVGGAYLDYLVRYTNVHALIIGDNIAAKCGDEVLANSV